METIPHRCRRVQVINKTSAHNVFISLCCIVFKNTSAFKVMIQEKILVLSQNNYDTTMRLNGQRLEYLKGLRVRSFVSAISACTHAYHDKCTCLQVLHHTHHLPGGVGIRYEAIIRHAAQLAKG